MRNSDPFLSIDVIKRNCEAASFGEYDWHDLLAEIAVWVGGDKAMLLGASSNGALTHTLSINHNQENIDRYNSGYNLYDPRRTHSKMTPVGQCGLGQQFVSNDTIRKTAYFADIAEFGDIQDSVHGIIVDEPELGRHSISVQRGFADEYFQPKEAKKLQAVLPMLAEAMRTSQRILALQNRRQQGDDQCYCLVRRDLTVQFIEKTTIPSFQSQEHGVTLTQTGWRFSNDKLRSLFCDAVANAIRGKDCAFTIRGARFGFSKPPANLDWLAAGGDCALVSVGRDENTTRSAVRLFARSCELTPKETELLLRLADGENMRKAADMMGAEYETARWHMKNICAKAGYSSSRMLIEDAKTGDLSQIL